MSEVKQWTSASCTHEHNLFRSPSPGCVVTAWVVVQENGHGLTHTTVIDNNLEFAHDPLRGSTSVERSWTREIRQHVAIGFSEGASRRMNWRASLNERSERG